MKPPDLWQEADLVQLMELKHEENIQLDYKGGDALQRMEQKKADISKDVSAFANSTGGTIIYGIEEDPEPPHPAHALSPIDPTEISKEWLEQVINSRIQPRIEGIRINPVELKVFASGKFAYIVVIPESATAHQASDKRYYKRFNFESVPMEDYEVRQTMSRASRPAYSLKLSHTDIATGDRANRFRFQGLIQNESEIVGHDVSVVLFVPRKFVGEPDDFNVDIEGIEYSRISGVHVESSHVTRSGVLSAHPLTPYAWDFPKRILLPPEVVPAERFTVIAKVHDRFGLSLVAAFHVYLQSYEIKVFNELHMSKRSPSRTIALPVVD